MEAHKPGKLAHGQTVETGAVNEGELQELRDGYQESRDREEISRLLRTATRLIEDADLSSASEKLKMAGELASRQRTAR